mgnify:CR=1 FL=1
MDIVLVNRDICACACHQFMEGLKHKFPPFLYHEMLNIPFSIRCEAFMSIPILHLTICQYLP